MGISGMLKQLGSLISRQNLKVSPGGGQRWDGWARGHHEVAYGFAQSTVVDRDCKPFAQQFLQQALSAKAEGVDLLLVFYSAPTPAKHETG